MKIKSYMWGSFLICLCVAAPVTAKQSLFGDDGEFLVQACQEAIDIYNSRDEEQLLASVRTSMSEAMRAGYCIGVLQQYIKHNSSCSFSRYRKSNWHTMAESIASISFGANAVNRGITASALLEQVYCDGL
ncbi:hypothetical protein L1D44_04740 [Shewanella sp. Isolate13]|uniref:hypothetical protein n=1 Tax=Shewanella sp. Isolate13 TaxID=2908531 RepID=UPI001EFD3D6E|nr:hypothetical protein [Shewanella sp. Isolate13]MCG9729151.1 hypothetical protein [Shewanella sp. Isolate13]